MDFLLIFSWKASFAVYYRYTSTTKMSSVFSTKFVRILQTFDEEERKAFEAWLQSPWCNSNKNLIRLFAKLQRYYPDFDDPKLTKEKLFRQVLPDGKFSHRRMNNLLSKGFLAAQEFLLHRRFSREEGLRNSLRAEEFQGRYLDDWFFREVDKEMGRLEAKAVKDWEEHLALFRLYRMAYHRPSQDARMRPGGSPIREMGLQLDLLYALEKAAIINEKLSRNRLIRDENHDVEAELRKWDAVSQGIQHPSIELYRMRFAYTEENRFEQYQELRTALLEHIGQLNQKEQKLHLLSLLNDTMSFIKSGRLDITESLPLYQLGLETGVLLHQGKLTRNTYTAIVVASNTKGTFEFTDHFIETYTKHLDEKVRGDCCHWASAHTAYWKRNLEKCLDILQKHSFKAPYFQMIGRVLLTQVYFDLYLEDDSYGPYLFSFFDTFEKWLAREKVWSKAAKTSFLRFVQKCRALARFYADVNFSSGKVEKLLEGETNIQALNWLSQKKEEVLRLRTN